MLVSELYIEKKCRPRRGALEEILPSVNRSLFRSGSLSIISDKSNRSIHTINQV